jgi:3-phenylpropionate/trans-cinnamate dioxygenase ferredoxin reductase subunit
MGNTTELQGPDLRAGVAIGDLAESEPFAGHDGSEAVVLVRQGSEVFALSATCTHWSGPLSEGLVTDGCIRCPWHHAQFSIRTGAAVAPALHPLGRWNVTVSEGVVRLGAKIESASESAASAGSPVAHARDGAPASVVIVGAGAGGMMAAETLRSEGYGHRITLIDADAEAPYDRPNLSKDYLAGKAPDEWIQLRDASFYEGLNIERVTASVTQIRGKEHEVVCSDGSVIGYGALVLATGAQPVVPPIKGAEQAHVFTLRSWNDARALNVAVSAGTKLLIAGASFIGLEAAAAFRARGVDVTVVAPEAIPFERVLGKDLGEYLRGLHEKNGVKLHLGRTVGTIGGSDVTLDDGTRIEADVVLLAVGVRPFTKLAEDAGLTVDRGVVVNERLQTSDPDIYAVGDIALYPGPSGAQRIEHWVVAQRQGIAAARNILGANEPFDTIPFFWTQHYDTAVNYVGHANQGDDNVITGDPQSDCRVEFSHDDVLTAVITINRDMESLRAEVALENQHSMSEQ